MTSHLDKALLQLSLEEDDEPFVLPDHPEYYSTGRNALSVVGRLLNPKCQSMADLILDMPRKWRLYDRVKGVALSKDKFQFIFKHEQDMIDVLNKGAHTHNMWPIALERWVEKPPEDYLQYISVWVQMRNIPINHYTKKALESLGDFAGKVEVVAFDPDKPQVRDYVRVLVRFDVSKPLRRAKKVTTPGGETVNILYDYERLQKRCYTCQRITHEQPQCPIFENLKASTEILEGSSAESKRNEDFAHLNKSDPLFGLIPEHQLGLDPISGRPKIAEEVLEDMRLYLKAASGAEKGAREERIRKSIEDLEKDPIAQKIALRLETPPTVTKDLDRGKGIVFDFSACPDAIQRPEKLLAGAITAGNRVLQSGKVVTEKPISMEQSDSNQGGSPASLTGYSAGSSVPSASGTLLKKAKGRKRPGTFTRRANGKGVLRPDTGRGKKVGEGVVTDAKRKAQEDVEPS